MESVRRLNRPKHAPTRGSAIELTGTSPESRRQVLRRRVAGPKLWTNRRPHQLPVAERRIARRLTRQNGQLFVGNRRQQTQAKAARERTVRERRERKQEKKRAAAAERKERAAAGATPQHAA